MDTDTLTTNTVTTTKLRHNFIDLCRTILFSDSKKAMFDGYETLFSDYSYNLLYGDDICGISLVEDIIIKILNEEDSDLYSKYGMQYTPFDRLVSLVMKQDEMIKDFKDKRKSSSITYSNTWLMMRRLVDNPLRILSNYLYIYLMENTVPLHSTRLKNCIYKNFTEFRNAKDD